MSALWRVRIKINSLSKYGSKTGIYVIRVHHGLSGNEKGINTADLRFYQCIYEPKFCYTLFCCFFVLFLFNRRVSRVRMISPSIVTMLSSNAGDRCKFCLALQEFPLCLGQCIRLRHHFRLR